MKGHPILGVISGLLFGLFGAATLFLFGVIQLHSWWFVILPILGLILGLVMAAWAPIGKTQPPPATTDGVSYGSATSAPPPSAGTTLEQEPVTPPSDTTDEVG